jgi:selT/selW/selH-like putative selenoprotein
LAAELETHLDETSHLVMSQGGVFEVEHEGQLIYSKKAKGRFPEDGEILRILHGLDTGLSLEEAQAEAGSNARPVPSFNEWLAKLFGGKRTPV